jgi:hypothetical protein
MDYWLQLSLHQRSIEMTDETVGVAHTAVTNDSIMAAKCAASQTVALLKGAPYLNE